MKKQWLLIFLPLIMIACSILGTKPAAAPVADEPLTEAEPAPVDTSPEEPTDTHREEPAAASLDISPTGPWMLQVASDGIYIRDETGHNPVSLPDSAKFNSINLYQNAQGEQVSNISIAPQGGRVAIVEVEDEANLKGLNLYLLTLPSGKVEFITLLMGAGFDALSGYDYEDIARKVAIGSPAWSPDGSKLAFLAALESPSLDLYLYDASSSELTRLTQGTEPLYGFSWSPDGSRLLFWDAASYDKSIGVIEAEANAGQPRMYTDFFPDATANFLGWRDAETYIFYAWNTLGAFNLNAFNLTTGESESIWDGYFTAASFDPKTRTTAICLNPDEAEYNGQSNGGLYLLAASDATPKKVAESCGAHLAWHPLSEVFSFSDGDQTYLLTTTGEVSGTELDDLPLLTSPGGAWQYKISIPDENGYTLLYKLENSGEFEVYYAGNLEKMLWQADGRRFFVQEKGMVHSINLTKINLIEFIEDVHFVDWVILK